jgi:hypothetical protein
MKIQRQVALANSQNHSLVTFLFLIPNDLKM